MSENNKANEPWFYRYPYASLPQDVLDGTITDAEAAAIQRYAQVQAKADLVRRVLSAMETRIERKIVEVLDANPSATLEEIEDAVDQMASYAENFRIMTAHMVSAVDEYYGRNPPDGIDPLSKEFAVKQAIHVHLTGT
jgi:hypothetical protein